MKLKDVLPDKEIIIASRTYDKYGEDILFGYCKWDGNNLIPLDRDYYSIEEEIIKYEYEEDGTLSYWYESKWI